MVPSAKNEFCSPRSIYLWYNWKKKGSHAFKFKQKIQVLGQAGQEPLLFLVESDCDWTFSKHLAYMIVLIFRIIRFKDD